MDKNNSTIYNSKTYGNNWIWPKQDTGVWKHFHHKDIIQSLVTITNLCNKKRTIIQAGKNCGIYPKYFSQFFDKVYTFEPCVENFYYLASNVTEDNVFKFQSALGKDITSISLQAGSNIGSYKVLGQGSIPQLNIDSFDLIDVDLIQLDIEGHEGYAIQGAIETIKRCKPWIMLETKSKNASHSIWTKKELDNLMLSIGYEIYSEPTRLDTIYKVKNEN